MAGTRGCVLTIAFVLMTGFVVSGLAPGEFLCITCAYDIHQKYNEIDCLNDTVNLLEFSHSVKCRNHCTIQENWNMKRREIESVFRTCSTDWGNKCDVNADHNLIVCKSSCKGQKCNNRTVLEENKIDELCKTHNCDTGTGSHVIGSLKTLSLLSFLTYCIRITINY